MGEVSRFFLIVSLVTMLSACSQPSHRGAGSSPGAHSGDYSSDLLGAGQEDSRFSAPDQDTNQPSRWVEDSGSNSVEDVGDSSTTGDTTSFPNKNVYECELGDTEGCISECGTVGERKCGKYWGPCVPPDEICNGMDDNCDGQIDEGVFNACGECGDAPFEVCDGLDNDCDGMVDEEVPGGCGCDGPTKQGEVTVNIPNLAPNCPFGQDDNLPPTGGKIAARVEQEVPFSLPDNMTMCSFEIAGGSSNFYFDDAFILTLNDVVLISSFTWAELKSSGNQLFYYSWPKIVGLVVQGGPECMPGATACDMPGTQTNGEVNLAFDEATNEKLVQTGNNGNHVFKVIASGDNDPPSDCHHTGLSLTVKYSYVN